MAGFDQAGGDLQSRKQGRRAVAFVLVVEAGERLAVGQLQPALGALQSLDVGLFIDRQDHGVLRRLQVERHDVRGLLRECRIGADAPAAPPLQRNLVLPQHPPDLVLGDVAQMLGQQGAVPTRISGRWRGVQSHENPPLMVLAATAQRTTRIRLGKAVTLLPLHNPVKLAEEAATAAGASSSGWVGASHISTRGTTYPRKRAEGGSTKRSTSSSGPSPTI